MNDSTRITYGTEPSDVRVGGNCQAACARTNVSIKACAFVFAAHRTQSGNLMTAIGRALFTLIRALWWPRDFVRPYGGAVRFVHNTAGYRKIPPINRAYRQRAACANRMAPK